MEGFLLIDKPKGVPSFRCVSVLRRITGIRRIGFAGTLDPLATGLMILAIGRGATKQLGNFSKMDKTYEVVIELGKISDSFDADGEIQCIKNMKEMEEINLLNKNSIQMILDEKFRGEREQVPPIFSAIQIGGKRAYALARQKKEIKLSPRKVIFYELEILSLHLPLLALRVSCSSGTYIRSLAHDLGQILGCGGYVRDLRRTRIGEFAVENALKLDDLNAENITSNLLENL